MSLGRRPSPVNISVETVVERNQLKLNELWHEAPLFRVEMLQSGYIGLVLGEGDLPHVNQTSPAVVIEHLKQNARPDLWRLQTLE